MKSSQRHRALSLANLKDEVQREDIKDIIKHIEEEARMVLPGIQAIFGFQLIAVFNAGFQTNLNFQLQVIHLVALGCVALAATLVLAPAAYHRVVEPIGVSSDLVRISSRFLTWGLTPLAVGLSLDFYLICRVILHRPVLSAVLGGTVFAVMSFFWFVLPRLARIEFRRRER